MATFELDETVLKSVAKTTRLPAVTSTEYSSFVKMKDQFRKCCRTLSIRASVFDELLAGNRRVEYRLNCYLYPIVLRALDETLVTLVDNLPGVETRYDSDNNRYTKHEFLRYYGPDGLEHWNNADVADTVVDVFDILAGVQNFFDGQRLNNALGVVRDSLKRLGQTTDVARRVNIVVSGLRTLTGMGLSKEERETLASAFSLSSLPGVEQHVVHYLSTAQNPTTSGLEQTISASRAAVGSVSRDSGRKRVRLDRSNHVGAGISKRDRDKADGLCNFCLKFGHSEIECNSAAKGISKAKFRDPAHDALRSKSINGVIPRSAVEKTMNVKSLKSINHRDYILINDASVQGSPSETTVDEETEGFAVETGNTSFANIVTGVVW